MGIKKFLTSLLFLGDRGILVTYDKHIPLRTRNWFSHSIGRVIYSRNMNPYVADNIDSTRVLDKYHAKGLCDSQQYGYRYTGKKSDIK